MAVRNDDEEVGGVSFLLGQLKNGMDTIIKTLSEDRTADAQYKTDVRKELQDHTDRMARLEAKVNEATSDIGEIKPIVTSLHIEQHAEKGAKDQVTRFGSMMSSFLNILAGLFGATIALVIDKMFLHK